MTTTLEQVLRDARSLPLEDQRLLAELIEPPKSLLELAAEQGVKPFDFAETQRAARFWPENESADEFVAAIREWRQDAKPKGENACAQ